MPMEVVRDDIWVCEDCLMWLCNGDASGMDEAQHERTTAGERRLVADGGHLSANFCSNHEQDCDHCGNEDDGIREFSSWPCDCCGSHLAGSRHRFALFGNVQRFAYGNGTPGCLFDHVSGPYESIAAAAESAGELLYLTLPEQRLLEADHIIYLRGDRAHEVGAQVIEIFEVDADWTDGSPD